MNEWMDDPQSPRVRVQWLIRKAGRMAGWIDTHDRIECDKRDHLIQISTRKESCWTGGRRRGNNFLCGWKHEILLRIQFHVCDLTISEINPNPLIMSPYLFIIIYPPSQLANLFPRSMKSEECESIKTFFTFSSMTMFETEFSVFLSDYDVNCDLWTIEKTP